MMNTEALARTPNITWKELFTAVAKSYNFNQADFLQYIWDGISGVREIWDKRVLDNPEKLVPVRNSLLMFVIPRFSGNEDSWQNFSRWDS